MLLVENPQMLARYEMVLKFSTGWKILIGEEHRLSFLCQRVHAFTPIISNDHMLIVGYSNEDGITMKDVYAFPVAKITVLIDGQHSSATSSKWTELTAATHSYTALIPGSSPPVIVGGWNRSDKMLIADIKMYDFYHA